MIAATESPAFGVKRRSRPVTMPTSSLPDTTGKPEKPSSCALRCSSLILVSGVTVTGSCTMAVSWRLTLRTSAACCSMLMFLWMMPMPPSCAIAMAKRASVTVSIAAETSGMFSSISRVRRVFRLTSFGRTSEYPGIRRTSSKVRASWLIRSMAGLPGGKKEARHYTHAPSRAQRGCAVCCARPGAPHRRSDRMVTPDR